MRLEKYLTEAPESIILDTGQSIDMKTIKKMGRKYKTENDFIDAVKLKINFW